MTAAIILAAGASGRLGRPKQNLEYKQQTLLQRTIATAISSGCEPVIVVLGANAQIIKPFIKDQPVQLLENPDWAEGMASSLRAGIQFLSQYPEVEQALVLLCDQPFVSVELIAALFDKQKESGKPIAASYYNDIPGVPVLFSRSFFPELLTLTGDEGAKKLLRKHPQDVVTVSFEQGRIDIDTAGDYERLLNSLL
jgi:molybdenum cofactor cytidylyltransferase